MARAPSRPLAALVKWRRWLFDSVRCGAPAEPDLIDDDFISAPDGQILPEFRRSDRNETAVLMDGTFPVTDGLQVARFGCFTLL